MFEAKANSTGSKQIFTLNNKYHLWKFLIGLMGFGHQLGKWIITALVSWERFCGRNQLKEHFLREKVVKIWSMNSKTREKIPLEQQMEK